MRTSHLAAVLSAHLLVGLLASFAQATPGGELTRLAASTDPGATNLDLGKVMRQVHFAYRSDAGDFAGGHSSYSVRVDGTGAWSFQPLHRPEKPAPLRIAAASIDIGEASAVVTAPKLSVAADGSLRIMHELAVESLRNTTEGVEQSWTFEHRPAGSGDVVVRVAISGQQYSGETQGGLHFVDPDTMLGVRYGVATWVDATGRRTEVRPRYDEGQIVITVPAAVIANSGFPAVLDPVLSPEQGTDNPVISAVVGGTQNPIVTWDGSNYLVVWSDCRDPFDGNTCGVWAARVNPTTGALVDPTGVPVVFNDGYTNFFNLTSPQGVACEPTQCLITWEANSSVSPTPLLKGRFFIKATPTAPGPEFTITSLPPDNWAGGAVAYNGSVYLVAYSLLAPSVNTIVGNIVHSSGAVDAQFVIAPSDADGNGVGQHRNPAIATDGSNFFVVWAEQYFVASANNYFELIFGQGVTGTGALSASLATITPTTEYWNHGQLFTTPAVAWDGVSHYVVAWSDERAGVSNTDIWAKQVSQTFVPDAVSFQVTADAGGQTAPALTTSGAGHLLATWDDTRGGVWGQLITSGPLASSGVNFSVASGGSSSAASNGSNYAVAYLNGSEAYVTGVAAAGGSQFAAERVSNAANSQLTPALAFDGTNYLAVWSDSRDTPSQHHIYASRIAANGAVLDPAGIAVSATADEASPEVAFAGASSSYLAVWTGSSGVYARRVNSDGSTPSAEQAISVPAGAASVASDGASFLIVGATPQTDLPGSISAALVRSDATLISTVAISTTTTPDAATPGVAYSPATGRYLVVWGEGGDIRGQRVTTAGAELDGPTGFVIANATGAQDQPSVTFDGTNFVVVWSDARSGSGKRDIYGARVNVAGVVLDASGALLSPADGFDKRFPKVGFDGVQTTVVWLDPETGNLVATQATPDLSTLVDTLGVATNARTDPPAIAAGGRGQVLIADDHFDNSSGTQSFRVRLRFLSNAGDSIAPTTVASVVPAPNGAGWNRVPVTVNLTATDNPGGTGVKSITVSASGAQPIATMVVTAATATVSISAEGQTTLTFFATDVAGNVEGSHALVVRVDQTPPVLTLPGPLTADATNSGGAPVSYAVSATDATSGTGAPVCAPPAGSVFPIGVTTVSCTATDVAGNSATGSFTVTVNGAPVQLRALIQLVDSFGLPLVLRLRLDAELAAALVLLGAGPGAQPAACALLNVFVQDAQAQSGHQLTAAQASQLVAAATRIRAVNGCH